MMGCGQHANTVADELTGLFPQDRPAIGLYYVEGGLETGRRLLEKVLHRFTMEENHRAAEWGDSGDAVHIGRVTWVDVARNIDHRAVSSLATRHGIEARRVVRSLSLRFASSYTELCDALKTVPSTMSAGIHVRGDGWLRRFQRRPSPATTTIRFLPVAIVSGLFSPPANRWMSQAEAGVQFEGFLRQVLVLSRRAAVFCLLNRSLRQGAGPVRVARLMRCGKPLRLDGPVQPVPRQQPRVREMFHADLVPVGVG